MQLSRQADDKISFFLAPTHPALVHPLHAWGSIKNDSYLLVLSPKSVTPPHVTFWTPNDTFCRKSGLFKWMDGWVGTTLKTAITTRVPVVLLTDVTSPCLSYRLCTYVATILPFKSVKSPKTDLFPHCLLLPLFAQFKRTHLSKIPIATHRSKKGSYLSSSGNSPIRAWCIQLKRMQQHESHSLGEEQNEFKIPLYFFETL